MDFMAMLLTVLGLCLFEAVSSLDNAIINAGVLSTMQPRARRWFLSWGILFAVFVVRGALPWLIVWLAMPGLSAWGALTATFSDDPAVAAAMAASAPVLLTSGAMFLLVLFIYWLFQESKQIAWGLERHCLRCRVWGAAVVFGLLLGVVWLSHDRNPDLALAAVVGSAAFYLTNSLRQQAARGSSALSARSDISKIIYLEVLDSTFSIDGVLGAFAFTLSVPLILVGNSLGAVVVRQMTIQNIAHIERYIYLKNGAMYSIFCLGVIMLVEAFGVHVPGWVSPVVTFAVIGYFWRRSLHHQPPAGT